MVAFEPTTAIVEEPIKIHQKRYSELKDWIAFIQVLVVKHCLLNLSPYYLKLKIYHLLNEDFTGTFDIDSIC